MLRSIMVPLDGSAFAEPALPTAYRLAGRDSATVRLVRVQERPLPITRAGGAPVRDPALDRELEDQAKRYLEILLGRLKPADRARTGTLLLHGPVVECLSSYARDQETSLVVMTTHARGAVSRAWLGSVADGLVHHSPAPVLLLRPPDPQSRPAEAAGFRRVLLPLDGSAAEDRILDLALAVAGGDGARFTLLRVLAPKDFPVRAALPRRGEEPTLRAQRATAEALLGARAATLRARGAAAEVKSMVDQNVASGILGYAAENGADLIVMATRSRGGLERLLLGSVADRVLRFSGCPLLVWNPLGENSGRVQPGADLAAAARARSRVLPSPTWFASYWSPRA